MTIEQKPQQKSSPLSKSQSREPLFFEKSESHREERFTNNDELRSHDERSQCDENHNQPNKRDTPTTSGSFSNTASHVAEKVKDAFIEGAIVVKEVVTGVGSKITEKASEYVHHANAAFKKKAALRRANKARQRQEEAEVLEKEAIVMYDDVIKSEIKDFKERLGLMLKELKALEERIRDDAFLLNEKHEKRDKEHKISPAKNQNRQQRSAEKSSKKVKK